MNVYLSWSDFKQKVSNNKTKIRFEERETFYTLNYSDLAGTFESSIWKNSDDCNDFEANFKATANQSIAEPMDSDGSSLHRIKVTNTGWFYQLYGLEFETSKLDSIYEKKADLTSYNFSTIKCYDSNDILLISQEDCNIYAVKTVIDWEPTYDYEIIGGFFKIASIPTEDVRLWVTGAPDIPAAYGGSKSFVSSVNLRFIGLEEGIRADGRTSKPLTYNPTYHTSKLRITLIHSAGFKQKMQVIFELFKP